MNKYNLIAIDLDDTLLRDDLTVSKENKEAIGKAIELGKKVVISTGRMYKSALPFASELGVTLPLITYQGALIKDSSTSEILWERPMPVYLASEVLAYGYAKGVHINLYYDDTLYVDSITEEAVGYANLARVECQAVGDLRTFLQGDPTKILFIGDPDHLDNMLAECWERFRESLHITKSKQHYLEFMHPQASKGKALEHLGQVYGIQREEMIAVGDSYNDLDMIKYAGLGVVMGNAKEDVKAQADYITLDNESDGVADVIKKFMLK